MPRTPKPRPDPAEESKPSLDDVLIAFQKTLGRANKAAQSYAQREIGFRTPGMQQLFGIGGLHVKIRCGLQLNGDDRDSLTVDFNPPPETASEIEFRIEPVSVQEVDTGVLLLHGTPTDTSHTLLEAHVLNQGQGVPSTPLTFTITGSHAEHLELSGQTDATGCCRLTIARKAKSVAFTLSHSPADAKNPADHKFPTGPIAVQASHTTFGSSATVDIGEN